MIYALAISTRGEERINLLRTWLPSLLRQTLKPDLILLVNNNEAISNMDLLNMVSKDHRPRLPIEVRSNVDRTPSDAAGSQLALEVLGEAYPVIVKWDDDLIPMVDDCMERLVSLVYAGFAAAGGMYYRLLGNARSSMGPNGPVAGDKNDNHLQFFRWSGHHTLIRRRHLYSSFAYDARLAREIGGFCVEYSQLSYRHETDFTLRLNKARPGLVVDTAAEALHLVAQGGIREFTRAHYERMAKKDQALFQKRMKAEGIKA